MNNPTEHPLVRAHLDAVDRYTAPLSAGRRRELLADLCEHVEGELAERDPVDEDAVRQVLERLGSPRQIADAALAEEGRTRPEPETDRRTTLTLVFAVLPMPLLLIPVIGPGLALVAAIVAAVRVTKAAQWTRREKTRATLLLLSPILATPLAAVVVASSTGLSVIGVLVACAVGFCPALVAAYLLARSAARLRTAALIVN
ncbi:hypothetical protein [Streptomyces sp. NPDC091212]|uniref:HAAS signaling domain-containing protein n=1 Tax=Streptomyces sp. NPDC091212 TaxID=3155191 RepID=UPI003442E14E